MIKNLFAAVAAMLGASAAFANAPAAVASAASGPVIVTAAEAGLLAGIVGFVAGWAIWLLTALALFGIVAEHNNSRGWAIFWLIIAGLVAFVSFEVSLLALALYAAAYIVIGLIWSFWRYKRHAAKTVELYRDKTPQEKERALRELHPKAMLATITAWIMIWPFSMVENILGDLINFIQELVTKFFRGVYHRIYDSAVSALK